MIKAGFYLLPGKNGNPDIFGEQRAVAPCGCSVVVGVRKDTQEVATGTVPCCEEHFESVLGPFNEWLRASLEVPTDRQLIDVVDEFLTDAAAAVKL